MICLYKSVLLAFLRGSVCKNASLPAWGDLFVEMLCWLAWCSVAGLLLWMFCWHLGDLFAEILRMFMSVKNFCVLQFSCISFLDDKYFLVTGNFFPIQCPRVIRNSNLGSTIHFFGTLVKTRAAETEGLFRMDNFLTSSVWGQDISVKSGEVSVLAREFHGHGFCL